MSEEYVEKWATVSLLLVFFSVLVYFGYMMHNHLMKTPSDMVVRLALPMGLLPCFAFFVTSEVLGCREFGRSRELCLKRFTGRVLLSLGIELPYFLFLTLTIMAGLLDSAHAFVTMIILVGWSGLVVLIVTRFKETVRKLTEGLW
jgi:hypothetical protein